MAKHGREWLESNSRRFFNRAAGFAIALATSPLVVAGTTATLVDRKGNPFYVQDRVGAEGAFGKPFKLWKLKTMEGPEDFANHIEEYKAYAKTNFKETGEYNEADFYAGLAMQVMAGRSNWNTQGTFDSRATRTGQLLRKLSIDEMPQALSMAAGKLAPVGIDRLLLDEDLAMRRDADPRLFDDEWYPAYKLYAGASGWAQIIRHDKKDRMERDDHLKAMYIGMKWLEDASWRTDARILAETIPSLVNPQRAYVAELQATAQKEFEQLQRAA
jgi:lipopolysaccharide/colanic/teichoic acid biosynthesis glycosyltransferase